jgi:YVTN family beta-propeller protein
MNRSIGSFRLGRAFDAHRWRGWFFALGFGIATTLSVAPTQAQQICGGTTYPFPYTDVSAVGAAFCPGIMEAYVTGVSRGTTPTTFSPNSTVTRVAMTTFLQRSLDQGLIRASRRAALNQWWTPQNTNALQKINVGGVGGIPLYCAADGENIWTSTFNLLHEVRASTGELLGTWVGAINPEGVAIANGLVYFAGHNSPGTLYVIDPTQPPPTVTTAANSLGDNPIGIAFDGTNLWTANFGPPGSVSIIDAGTYSVTNVTTGFTFPQGILYDGAHIWVTDGAGTLLKLDAAGAILQTVTVGTLPQFPVFDGTNIWVPNENSNSITVVQASTGNVLATISADVNNKLSGPTTASFDGERILVTNQGNNSVTVFKAADLSLLANVPTGGAFPPTGACSDGVNFWVGIAVGQLLRF